MGSVENYETLDAERIVQTVQRLSDRIRERFGSEAGLYRVCCRLNEIAAQAQQRGVSLGRPIWSLRLAVGLVVVLTLGASVAALLSVELDGGRLAVPEFIQVMEAAINDLVLIGAALFFLVTLETRFKRGRALRAIHEIRSVAHIIDMHQLTKDPDRLRSGIQLTTSSPRTSLNAFELGRYLDYCSEMLSLTGKIAVVYVQNFDDAVTIASANEVEQICTSLSRKIWQKIRVLRGEG